MAGSVSGVTAAKVAFQNVSAAQVPGITVVGRQGLEPWTYGLKALLDAVAEREVSTARSQDAADPVTVLRAVARGDGELARDGGRELALQVLRSPAARLALQVLAGGEHVDSRIVELCEAVLDDAGDVAKGKRGAA